LTPCGTLDARYEAARPHVEGVRFAQVGVALASPDGGLALVRVWRFHLGDRLDSEDTRFLAAVGVDPPRGVLTLAACAGRSGPSATPRHGEPQFLGFCELSSSCPLLCDMFHRCLGLFVALFNVCVDV